MAGEVWLHEAWKASGSRPWRSLCPKRTDGLYSGELRGLGPSVRARRALNPWPYKLSRRGFGRGMGVDVWGEPTWPGV
jgi:hypothetical protein